MGKAITSPEIRRCVHCGATETPLWRTGPDGPKSLCNACGVRMKKGKMQLYRNRLGQLTCIKSEAIALDSYAPLRSIPISGTPNVLKKVHSVKRGDRAFTSLVSEGKAGRKICREDESTIVKKKKLPPKRVGKAPCSREWRSSAPFSNTVNEPFCKYVNLEDPPSPALNSYNMLTDVFEAEAAHLTECPQTGNLEDGLLATSSGDSSFCEFFSADLTEKNLDNENVVSKHPIALREAIRHCSPPLAVLYHKCVQVLTDLLTEGAKLDSTYPIQEHVVCFLLEQCLQPVEIEMPTRWTGGVCLNGMMYMTALEAVESLRAVIDWSGFLLDGEKDIELAEILAEDVAKERSCRKEDARVSP